MGRVLALIAVVSTLCAGRGRAGELPVFQQVAGEIRTLRVQPGDTLVSLGGRTGVPWATLARLNGIADPDRIYVGQELRADTRRIVPEVIDDGLVVNVPEATLYVFEAGKLVARYPVGLGRLAHPTPLGSLAIIAKESAPGATPPRTVTEELEAERTLVERKAAPQRGHPLSRFWLQLSVWGYGVYGTPFAGTLGQFLGYGCIRMGLDELAALYERVDEGTRVEVQYLPVKLAVTRAGEIWVEAHPDVYGLAPEDPEAVLAALRAEGVADRVDVEAVEEVLAARSGVPQKVGSTAIAAVAAAPGTAEPPVAAPAGAGRAVQWRCLDCPPGTARRVTFQVEAVRPVDLPNPFPIEILDDAGRVVFRPQMVAQVIVHLDPGQTRNFVWEVRDSEGQPLPPGSYTAVIRFVPEGATQVQRVTLPLWVGK
ncbi:MAG: hypothetical protein Kow0092_31510 [Deferrisomatales bacterium]